MEALQLRSISVERLPDEEQEEQATDNEPTPVKRGLLHRAKKMMAGDPVKALAKALLPVREMLRRWSEIKAAHDAECDETAYTKNLEKAHARFAETHSPEDHERVFLAKAVLAERQKGAEIARRGSYSGSLELEWMQFPDVRDKIKKACALKIEATKVELERVRRKEQSHLGPKYDADDSPLVKERAGKVELWEQQLTQLNTRMTLHDPILEAQRFLAAARLLLENDESGGARFINKTDGDIYSLVCVDLIKNPDLAEYEHTHHLQSAVGGKYWSGTKADFEKCFKKS
jgi:hypothetical protein